MLSLLHGELIADGLCLLLPVVQFKTLLLRVVDKHVVASLSIDSIP